MGAKINLLGQRFGKLTVIEETNKRKNKSVVWKCKCDCGNEEELLYSTKELRNDGVQMCPKCGNARAPKTGLIESLIGKTFGQLTVISVEDGKQVCRCSCGAIKSVRRQDLLRTDGKQITSCGCANLQLKVGSIINNKKIIALNGTESHTYTKGHYYRVKCLLCGREYDSLPANLKSTEGCGCISSIGNKNITKVLSENNIPFRSEYSFQELSKKRYDFCIMDEDGITPIRLVEFDGEQHFAENVRHSGWNTTEHYQRVIESDTEKNLFAKKMEIPLVRIPYTERYNISLDMILGDKYLIK